MEKKACAQRQKTIMQCDLPLSCPMDDERLWDAHPKIYLSIEKMGSVVCPYCETEYRLVDDANK